MRILLAYLSFGFVALPVQSVTIPDNYMRAFESVAAETTASGIESLWCLIGSEEGLHYKVTAVVKPYQVTYQSVTYKRTQTPGEPVDYSTTLNSGVSYNVCPDRTVMTLHTHPYGSTNPSDTDWRTWTGYEIPMNGIMAELPDGSVILNVWDRAANPVEVRKP